MATNRKSYSWINLDMTTSKSLKAAWAKVQKLDMELQAAQEEAVAIKTAELVGKNELPVGGTPLVSWRSRFTGQLEPKIALDDDGTVARKQGKAAASHGRTSI